MKKLVISAALLLVSCCCLVAQPQSLLKKPLNKENARYFDEFIRRHAPADSAFNVMAYIAKQHFFNGRAMVAREVFVVYGPLFHSRKKEIDNEKNALLQVGLTQAPSQDAVGIYERIAREIAPTEDSFVLVQRLAERFINRRDWDSAAAVYGRFKPLFPGKQKYFNEVISLLLAPEEGIAVRNLGPAVNSKFDEWDPNPTPDGKHLFFSSSRPGTRGLSDVWECRLEGDRWSAPRNLGRGVNGDRNETIDNISADGTTLLLSGDFPGSFGKFDIYTATLDSSGWGNLRHLPMPVNSGYQDESGNFTADGKALVFTSDRPGGVGSHVPYGKYHHGSVMGNMDIYVTFMTDSGWSEPVNLGPKINTPYAERSAYLHPDGKTLYFSSDGHPGLGRLDIFKSVRLKEDSWTEWSEPVNLGKEVNTAMDDWGYKVTVGGDSAFFAGNMRPDGYGGWDLFTAGLPGKAKPDRPAVVSGRVLDGKGRPLYADIYWEDLTTGENSGRLKSNPFDGSYFIALPLGKFYGFYASKSGFYPGSSNLDLRNAPARDIKGHDIILVSNDDFKKHESTIRINNIFFDFDKYFVKPESYPELDRLAAFLKQFPGAKLEIHGHTDNSGNGEYNMELSRKRAEAVRNYMLQKGFSPANFSVKGFGAAKPVADNSTEEGRAQNRRVEVFLP